MDIDAQHTEAQRSKLRRQNAVGPGPVMVVDCSIFCQAQQPAGSCMHLTLERGVPPEERQKVALGTLTDWDAARVFLQVLRGPALFTRHRAVANRGRIRVLSTYACAPGGEVIPLGA